MKKRLWHQSIRHERQVRGWTQEQVAEMIGSNAKTITRWEKGETLPRPYNQQELARIFGKTITELGFPFDTQETPADDDDRREPLLKRQEDLWDAPHIENFYGRSQELSEARRWLLDDTCRMIMLRGIGGVGKTTLAAMLVQQVKSAFQFILWISLCDAPLLEDVLERCLFFFSGKPDSREVRDVHDEGSQIERHIALLLAHFREHRCLLVLDNFEAVFQEGSSSGRYREGYEHYGMLLQRLGETRHQGCILLTGREKPGELALLESATSAVRTLHLAGVEYSAGRKILEAEMLQGPEEVQIRLIDLYGGNPLALKLIAEPIRTVFGGEITAFLRDGELVLGGVRALLDRQFRRLSDLEQETLYWLAIEREPLTLSGLRADILHPIGASGVIEALNSLRQRSLIEADQGSTRFTLQPVIMEYVTERLISVICVEIEHATPRLFSTLALMKAQARDYTRRSQIHLILKPVLGQLLARYGEEGLAKKLQELLALLHRFPTLQYGYAAGNLLNMLIHLRADLRESDFSTLVIRQAYIQGVALPGVNFSHADLSTSVFNETFSSILWVTLSRNGKLLAAGTTRGEIRLWHAETAIPLLTCLGHTHWVLSIDFNRDSTLLVSGSEDHTVRIWDTESGQCLKILKGHAGVVSSVAFSPQGELVASGSEDGTVRLWDTASGRCLLILQDHASLVRSIAFSPDGQLLASSDDRELRLWDIAKENKRCIRTLRGPHGSGRSIAFCPTNDILASGDDDGAIRLWAPSDGTCLATLRGHSKSVRSVAFSPGGTMLASSSDDETIRLWEANPWRCTRDLRDHNSRVRSVTFDPSGERVVSASADQTVRFWEVRTGYCLRTLQGYTNVIKALAFSPDGQLLAAGSDDHFIRLWEVRTGRCLRTLQGHSGRLRSLTFSPDGTLLASGGEDETVRVWQVRSGQCLKTLRGHTHLVRSVAFSKNNHIIASGSYDRTVRLWDARSGACLQVLRGHADIIWEVAFHSDDQVVMSCGKDRTTCLWDVQSGGRLHTWAGQPQRVRAIFISPAKNVITGGSEDQTIYLWESQRTDTLRILKGHTSWVRALAFSPDGALIASGSHDQHVRIWNIESGECLRTLVGQGDGIESVAFSPNGRFVAGGSGDGLIVLWDVRTGEHIRTLHSERPYEGMKIIDAKGLSEPQRASLVALGAVEYEP